MNTAQVIRLPASARLLVRGVNWLGDAVVTTPALIRLRQALPNAHVTLLTPEKLAGLWHDHPALNDVLTFAPGQGPWQVGRVLRRCGFDAAVLFPNSIRSALELWFGGVPVRIGYAGQWRSWLLTCAVARRPDEVPMRKRGAGEVRRLITGNEGGTPPPTTEPRPGPRAHHIHHYLHLAGAFGAQTEPIEPCLAVSDAEIQALRSRLGIGRDGGTSAIVVGLNPGAEYGPAKRWPAESFVAAATQIIQRTECVTVILGGHQDVESAEGIERGIRRSLPANANASSVLNLAGRTTLIELCAALKLCRVLLTGDTGPMHLAAALGTPVVALFGSTSPELTGPGLPGSPRHCILRAMTPCAPCFLRRCPIDFRCMTGIGVDQAVEAVVRRCL